MTQVRFESLNNSSCWLAVDKIGYSYDAEALKSMAIIKAGNIAYELTVDTGNICDINVSGLWSNKLMLRFALADGYVQNPVGNKNFYEVGQFLQDLNFVPAENLSLFDASAELMGEVRSYVIDDLNANYGEKAIPYSAIKYVITGELEGTKFHGVIELQPVLRRSFV